MSELEKYLRREGIDNIEDDELFMRAELEAIFNYCYDKNFELSDDDIKIIYARGLEDSFDFWRDNVEKD